MPILEELFSRLSNFSLEPNNYLLPLTQLPTLTPAANTKYWKIPALR